MNPKNPERNRTSRAAIGTKKSSATANKEEQNRFTGRSVNTPKNTTEVIKFEIVHAAKTKIETQKSKYSLLKL